MSSSLQGAVSRHARLLQLTSRGKHTVLVACSLLFLLFSCTGRAVCQLSADLSVGLNGKYVARAWNAASATVVNAGQPFPGELWVYVREMGCAGEQRYPSSIYSVPVDFARGITCVDLALLVPYSASSATLQIARHGNVLLEEKVSLERASWQSLPLIITNRPEAFAVVKDYRPEAVILAPGSAPTDARAYDAADVIVLDDCRIGDLPERVCLCVREWAATGGRLVLTAPFLAENAGSPELTELTRVQVVAEPAASSMRGVADAFCPKGVAGPLAGKALGLKASWPDVLAATGDRPLAFLHGLGTGTVLGVAVDPEWMDFDGWPSQHTFARHFWAKVLQEDRHPPFPRSTVPWSVVPPESRACNTAPILVPVLVVFLIVAGPINWAVLRAKKRNEWVVFTVPAMALAFLLVLGIASLVIHERQPLLAFHSINVCTAGVRGAGVARVHGVLAPTTGGYDLAFGRPDAVVGEFRQDQAAWEGGVTPGTWFHLAGTAALPRLRINRWSMRCFSDTELASDGSADGVLRLTRDGLSGYVESHLPVVLEDCYLIHKWNHKAVGDIRPGERRRLSLDLGPPDVSDYTLSRLPSLTGLYEWLDRGLWDQYLAGTRWDLARVAAEQVAYTIHDPVLIGWGDRLAGPPTSTVPNCRRSEEHLFIVRLPIVAPGPEFVVPVGGAPCGDCRPLKGRWLSTNPLQPEAYEPHQYYGTTLELALPLGQPSVSHRELTVCGRLRPAYSEGPETAVQLALYDWHKQDWTVISEDLKETFSLPIPQPDRFILDPAGSVRVKVRAPDDQYAECYRLVWLDLEYRGEAATQ